jgi:hypothetical protein
MKNLLIICILLFYGITLANSSSPQLVSGKIGEIAQYETLIFKFYVPGDYQNPFYPGEVNLEGVVSVQNGDTQIVSGYFDGDSTWYLKYTPADPGLMKIRFLFYRNGKSFAFDSLNVMVYESENDGFIRVDTLSSYNFRFDSGKIFRGIGENVCWTQDFEYYFKKLKENGCNFTRIWMCPWSLHLEWSETGLGRYDLQNARKLDSLLILAEKYDLYLMLCFDYHGVVQRGSGHFDENKWAENPYNSANGGPCRISQEFFSDSLARDYYKKRLRYIVARYGHSSRIQSWEFWNEVNLTTGRPKDVINWHWEMGKYLREFDPYKHLITSSFSSPDYPKLWQCEYLDFSQIHIYNNSDLVMSIQESIDWHEKMFEKPHVIGEYGVEYRGARETIAADSLFIGIHNGQWAGLVSNTPILPMTWWWDSVIDSNNLYFEFENIANLWHRSVRDTSRLTDLHIIPYSECASWDTVLNFGKDSLVIYPNKKWERNTYSYFHIDNNGKVLNKQHVPSILYGSKKRDLRNPPEFHIKYHNDGRFEIHVDRISMHGHLKIYLDDSLALNMPLPLEPNKGDWEDIRWSEHYQRYQGRYNKTYAIDVPAGAHRIFVKNDSLDWFEVSYYKFENCGIREQPEIEASGIRIDQDAIFWVRNKNFAWKRIQRLGHDRKILNAALIFPQMQKGGYRIEWLDTYTGKLIKHDIVDVSGHAAMQLAVPPLQRDFAGRIVLLPEITRVQIILTLLLGLLVCLTVFWIIRVNLKKF